MPANYKNGIIGDGSSIGQGAILGNYRDGIIRKGNTSTAGVGIIVGNVRDGFIRQGNSSTTGIGVIIANVRDGKVFKENSSKEIGRVSDFKILGMERELDVAVVAAYHFLVKKIV